MDVNYKIMNKLTPKQRRNIYKKAYKEVKDDWALCPILSSYTTCHWTNKKEFKKLFPEFNLFKPKKLRQCERWFDFKDPNQAKYRKTILEFCIEMTKDAKE